MASNKERVSMSADHGMLRQQAVHTPPSAEQGQSSRDTFHAPLDEKDVSLYHTCASGLEGDRMVQSGIGAQSTPALSQAMSGARSGLAAVDPGDISSRTVDGMVPLARMSSVPPDGAARQAPGANLVDFNQADFRSINGDPMWGDLGTGRQGGVFVGGLRFTSYARTYVRDDGSGDSSQLVGYWMMRVNAMRGDMNELTFQLKSTGPVQVNFYDASGQLINTDTVDGGSSGTTVSFADADGRAVAYFTIGNQDFTQFSIDDINYTAGGKSDVVDFTNAEFKFADGTVATQDYFDTRSVFIGTMEINSSNTMFQYPRNGASDGGGENYLSLYGWSDTTFTLHKQNVQTVSFDAEFRGDGNVIVFYDANNAELGRIEANRTEGHGGNGQAAKVWVPIRFPSEGASIAYFTVMSGKQQGHGGISIDNISYPQTEGAPTARSMVLSGGQDDVVIDELPELGATGQVPAGERVQLDGKDVAPHAAPEKLLALSLGEQDLLDQATVIEEEQVLTTASDPANDVSASLYPATSLETEMLMNGMSSQSTLVF